MPPPKPKRWIVGVVGLVAALQASVAAGYIAFTDEDDRAITDRRPNVVVIMTDDQRLDDMQVMPITKEKIGGEGVTFAEAFVTYPLCCPSRVTLLTGQLTHNHKVFGNAPPIGGYTAYKPSQENSLPVWLRNAGYTTALVGKFLNGYGNDDPIEVPPGWDHWRALTSDATYRMWGYQLNEDGKLRVVGRPGVQNPNLYQTDVLAESATGLIAEMAGSDKPFFLQFNPTAPHREAVGGAAGAVNPRPAPRHAGTYRGSGLPDTNAFNEADTTDKAEESLIKGPLKPKQVSELTDHARGRLESLGAVDEAVGRLIETLRTTGELDNTLVVFTSDNGYLLGEHRYNGTKYYPYDPSTRVPLLMRGPGLPKGVTSAARVLNPDVTATIVEATGSSPGRTLDGRSLLPLARDPQATPPRPLLFEGSPLGDLTDDPTYAADIPDLAKRSSGYVAVRSTNWLWIAYERGGRELYDLNADPDQINSRAADPTLDGLRQELQQLLVRMRQCEGENCWNVPAGP